MKLGLVQMHCPKGEIDRNLATIEQLLREAAASGLYGEQATRNWQSGFAWWQGECRSKLARYARENRIWIAVATQAGRTIDEDYPGGGYLFAPDGRCVVASADWSPGILYADAGIEG